MALFGDDDEETQEVEPPEFDETEAEDEDPSEPVEDGDGAAEPEAADDEAPADPPSEEAGAGGENIDVEDALKDLSARLSMLSSNLEGVRESRGELEDKIVDVEERMSRLGSLAEAVSSEYNPFVSENAPTQPSWTPEPEEAEPGEEPAPEAASTPDEVPEEPGGEAADPDDASDAGGEPDPAANRDPPTSAGSGDEPDDEDPDEAPEPAPAERPHPGLDGGRPPEDDPEPGPGKGEGPVPRTDPAQLEPTAEIDGGGREEVVPEAASALGRPGTNGKPGELEENLLMLEWVGMMLDRVGRAGLMDLLDYYQNLGWLDPQLKDHVTRVAVGVEAPDRVGDGHWRGDVDLHRRSLVAIQRLQGDEVSAARLDELDLDLRRLFRE